jgi:glycosyltransferase involved in cell wall biosynthesis
MLLPSTANFKFHHRKWLYSARKFKIRCTSWGRRLLKRAAERSAYLLMLLSINLGFVLVNILRFISPLIPKNHSKDIIFFPYAETNSAGYDIRFKAYFNFLKNENYQFDIMTYYDDIIGDEAFLSGDKIKQYYFYQAILWKRIPQILRSRNYKTAFVQRSLFPWYPDYNVPYLEMLLKKICEHVIVDIWDANHVAQPALTYSIISSADRVCVVNSFLYQCYKNYNQDMRVWPIAVDTSRYLLKKKYDINYPVKLLYTGSVDNVKTNLVPLLPLLKKIEKIYALELIVIGKYAPEYKGLSIRHCFWDEKTYFKILIEADIGLYPVFNHQSEINQGKVAAKTLDYLATGLPFIGSRNGVPEGMEDGNCFIAADDLNEWELQLTRLIRDQALRQEMAENGRRFVEEELSLESSYAQLKEICFNWH